MSFHDMYMAITRVEARALAIGRGHEGQMSIGLPELSDSAVQNLEEKGYTVSRGKRLGPPDVTPRYLYDVCWEADPRMATITDFVQGRDLVASDSDSESQAYDVEELLDNLLDV